MTEKQEKIFKEVAAERARQLMKFGDSATMPLLDDAAIHRYGANFGTQTRGEAAACVYHLPRDIGAVVRRNISAGEGTLSHFHLIAKEVAQAVWCAASGHEHTRKRLLGLAVAAVAAIEALDSQQAATRTVKAPTVVLRAVADFQAAAQEGEKGE